MNTQVSDKLQPFVEAAHLFGAEAQPFGGPRREVLDEHIGLTDEVLEDRLALRMLEVEAQTFLAAVGPHEMARHAVDSGVIAAGEVSGSGSFDLDHASAQVGELPGCERCRHGLLAADDGDPGQGKFSVQGPSTTRIQKLSPK